MFYFLRRRGARRETRPEWVSKGETEIASGEGRPARRLPQGCTKPKGTAVEPRSPAQLGLERGETRRCEGKIKGGCPQIKIE